MEEIWNDNFLSMKILFLINCLSYGGAEKNLKLVANYMVEQGDDVQVCSLSYQPTTINFDEKVRVMELSKRNGHFLKLLIVKYFELKKIVKREKPDIMISFLGYANLLNVLLGKSCNIPCIISERADPYLKSPKWGANVVTKLFQWIYTFADGAVFQTPKARDYFAKRLRKCSVVIPNPVVCTDDIPEHIYEWAEKRIAFVGRFELKQKRQDIALKAFREVLMKHPNYIMSFYGDGQDEELIKQQVKKMGLEDNVTFNSVSENVLSDISTAYLFLLTSDYEGIPNCLIEALSIGMPCVSTDCSPGGARILIDHNENGLIVPCGDVSAIANAICFYIENSDIAKKHGQKALNIRNRYSLNNIMECWKQYLHSFNKLN